MSDKNAAKAWAAYRAAALWTKASGELRRSLGLKPLSREEAERFYAEAKGSDLDEATIDRIVSSVRGENPPVTTSAAAAAAEASRAAAAAEAKAAYESATDAEVEVAAAWAAYEAARTNALDEEVE